MNDSLVLLAGILFAGFLGKNPLVSICAFVLLVLQLSKADKAIMALEEYALDLGVLFLLLGVLLPFGTGKISLSEALNAVLNWRGLISIAIGALAAALAARGVDLLKIHPEVMIGLVTGSILGVWLFRGIPAGPLVAAGIVAVVLRLIK